MQRVHIRRSRRHMHVNRLHNTKSFIAIMTLKNTKLGHLHIEAYFWTGGNILSFCSRENIFKCFCFPPLIARIVPSFYYTIFTIIGTNLAEL